MFKVFIQENKKYYTIRIFKSLFQSRLWFFIKHILFGFIFAYIFYKLEPMSIYNFMDNWLGVSFLSYILSFAANGINQAICSGETCYEYTGFAQVLLNHQNNIFCEIVFMLLIYLFPAPCTFFKGYQLYCEEILSLFCITDFKSDKRFCYFSVFCHRIKSTDKDIGNSY